MNALWKLSLTILVLDNVFGCESKSKLIKAILKKCITKPEEEDTGNIRTYKNFSDPHELYCEWLLIKIQKDGQDAATFQKLHHSKLLKRVIKLIDNMIDDRNNIAWRKMCKRESRLLVSDLMGEMNDIAQQLILNDESREQVMEENISLETFPELKQINSSFQFPSRSSNISKVNRLHFTRPFQIHKSKECFGVVYKELASKLSIDSSMKPNSDIVGFNIGQKSITLSNISRVRIYLTHTAQRKRGEVPVCVFWDPINANWNKSGCSVLKSTKSSTICECDHLTNFAVLMDISGKEEANATKNVLTIICSIFSMICLVVTFVCLMQIKCLHNRRTTITKNLCVSLFLVNLIVTFGLDRTDNTRVCQGISLLLMFSIASSFLWMLLQGYVVYQMVILVFAGIAELSRKMMYIIGYGVAVIWLVIAYIIVGGASGFYDSEYNYFCWISSHIFDKKWNIFVFAGPSIFIILLNFIVFLLCLNAIFFKRKRTQKMLNRNEELPHESDRCKENESNSKRWLNGWISMMVLLGLTWITGLLYLHTTLYFMSYVFIVLNGLQGFFIFLLEIVCNRNARNTIIYKMKSSLMVNNELFCRRRIRNFNCFK